MTPDSDLLRQYAENHDEAAFTEIVQRYVNLIYATALRLLNGDAHLAQDATQAVFTDMGRHAVALIDHATVAGWLHTSARFHASKIARTERRRHAREQKVYAMTNQTTTTEISWDHLAPLLDDALGQLAEADRDALLLRFFQGKSHREVGTILGLDENTARMRVTRVLEKLRDHFARYGVTTTAALLASTLGTQAAGVSVPATFAEAVARESLAGVAKTAAVAARTTAWPVKMALVFAVVMIFAVGYSLPIYTKYDHAISLPQDTPAGAANVRPSPGFGKVAATPDPAVKVMDGTSNVKSAPVNPGRPPTADPDVLPDALLSAQSLVDAEQRKFDIAGMKITSNITLVRILHKDINSAQIPYIDMYIWPGTGMDGLELPLSRFNAEDQEYIKKWASEHALDKTVGKVAPDVQAVLDKFVETPGRRPIVSAGRSLQN